MAVDPGTLHLDTVGEALRQKPCAVAHGVRGGGRLAPSAAPGAQRVTAPRWVTW